jgi:hypothetical protein
VSEAAVKQRLCEVGSDALGAAGRGLGENSRLGSDGAGKEGSAWEGGLFCGGGQKALLVHRVWFSVTGYRASPVVLDKLQSSCLLRFWAKGRLWPL